MSDPYVSTVPITSDTNITVHNLSGQSISIKCITQNNGNIVFGAGYAGVTSSVTIPAGTMNILVYGSNPYGPYQSVQPILKTGCINVGVDNAFPYGSPIDGCNNLYIMDQLSGEEMDRTATVQGQQQNSQDGMSIWIILLIIFLIIIAVAAVAIGFKYYKSRK